MNYFILGNVQYFYSSEVKCFKKLNLLLPKDDFPFVLILVCISFKKKNNKRMEVLNVKLQIE